VTILSGPGGFVESGATINVAGGAGGGAGVIDIAFVPAPASLVLLGTGLLGLLGTGWPRCGRARAADGC
jgi:hypothetical protein